MQEFTLERERVLHSATHEEILEAATTDIYFVKSFEILKDLGLESTPVTAEIFAGEGGILAGMEEALNLLRGRKVQVWALPEGTTIAPKEVVMRITGPYGEFGVFETALLGMLASASGWATRAGEVVAAADGRPAICFGARHVHPAVAPVMERAAVIGGMSGASCILAAKLLGRQPSGTIPHAAILIVGDTVKAAQAYHRVMPSGEARIILVDTFKDEAEESLRVAGALGEALGAIRLDTPSERGRVTPALVSEVRARLNLAGYGHVRIFVSGGVTPDRIPLLAEAGADGFGVGGFIAAAPPIFMTMDIKEIDGKPVAKRGRIPGITANPRLEQVNVGSGGAGNE